MSLFLRLVTALCLLFAAAPAHAASTEWTESEGGRVRIVALPPTVEGRVDAVLDIALNPGWKTYWRDPGASGMAPQLDFSASTNLVLDKTAFPPPALLAEGSSSLIGYDKPVRIVLTFRQPVPGAPSVLEGHLIVGICEEICIPVMMDVRLDLLGHGQSDPQEFGLVRMAEAELPEPPSDDFAVRETTLSSDGKTLSVTLVTPGKTSPSVYLENPPGFSLSNPFASVNPDGTVTVNVTVRNQPSGESLAGKTITLLAVAGRRAMETGILPK